MNFGIDQRLCYVSIKAVILPVSPAALWTSLWRASLFIWGKVLFCFQSGYNLAWVYSSGENLLKDVRCFHGAIPPHTHTRSGELTFIQTHCFCSTRTWGLSKHRAQCLGANTPTWTWLGPLSSGAQSSVETDVYAGKINIKDAEEMDTSGLWPCHSPPKRTRGRYHGCHSVSRTTPGL